MASLALVAAPAGAQPARPTRATPAPVMTPAAVTQRLRTALEAGRAANVLADVEALPPRLRAHPEVVTAKVIATFMTLNAPLDPSALRTMPQSSQRDLVAIQSHLARWMATHPNDGLAALILGRVYLVRGDLASASTFLETATRVRRTDPVAWNDRAMVLVGLRRLPDAELCLAESTRLAPRDAEPWDNLGAVRLARGNAQRAAEAFRHAVEIEPGEARYHSDLGSALLAAGDVEGAIGSYRRALALDARSSVVTANLGYALSLANRHEEAVTTLRHAVELDPNNVTALDNLGTALARRGDRTGAVEAFTRAQAIEPNDARARTGLEALDAGVTGAAH